MKEPQYVAVAADSVKLVQITDFHLVADPAGTLLGVNTEASFQAVVDLVRAGDWPCDAVLATGDLAQDGARATYQRLFGYLSAFGVPTFWLPGNHDDPALMESVLDGETVIADGRFVAGAWQVVLLNTTIVGEVGGRLAEAELRHLDDALGAEPERHALVCLHHHPVSMGSAWMEPIGLENREAFTEVLARHANVRGVLWGHVHQEYQTERDGVVWMSTPSTCFQFKPESHDFAVDNRLPGYRWLHLHPDGSIETGVERLRDYDLGIDAGASGY